MNAEVWLGESQVIDELIRRHHGLDAIRGTIESALDVLLACWESGAKIMVCGNGGSAADSEHCVGELMKSFKFKREVDRDFADAYVKANGSAVPDWLEGALPAISLVSQTGLMTAFSNDESAVGVFAQQVYGYGCPGDVLLAISTSGNSGNVIEAAKVARAKGVKVISLTGASESKLTPLSDVCMRHALQYDEGKRRPAPVSHLPPLHQHQAQ
jgi:phosphoheptose isomerase